MKNLLCEQLGAGQHFEDMGCAFADLGTRKVDPNTSHPSYLDVSMAGW